MVDDYFIVVIDLYFYLQPRDIFDNQKFEKLVKQIEELFSSKQKLKIKTKLHKDLWDYLLNDIITKDAELQNISIH